MGEKSFLSILKEEHKIVKEIGFKKSDMFEFLQGSEKADGNQEFYKKQYEKAASEVVELEDRLVSVRKEMQKYIKFIMEV